MKQKSLLFVLILFIFLQISASAQEKYLGAAISNNAPSLPVTGIRNVFQGSFHPGVDVNYSKKFNKKEVNQWLYKVNAGLIWQKYVQTLFTVSGMAVYRNNHFKSLNFDTGIGAGYGAAFEGGAVLKLNKDGVYETRSKFSPRSQFVILLQAGIIYKLKKEEAQSMAITLHAKTIIQGPFVKGYVPLLPINAIELGVLIPLKKKNENK
jgi:hypothetical protein